MLLCQSPIQEGHNLPLAADMVVDGIQKYHRIDTLQGPLLPFPKSEKQTS